jgi:DNA-binding NarL/FixJ family response regulator
LVFLDSAVVIEDYIVRCIDARMFCVRLLVMSAVTIARPRIRIFVADDHSVIRRMVRTTLEEHAHFEVCAEAENGAEAVELAKQVKPDVAILNIMMPVLNGFDAAREIRRQVPQSAIVILSTHADRLFIDEAKKIGVRAYVAKSDVGEALVKAVEAAVQGEDFVVLE